MPCYNEARTVDEIVRRVLAQPVVAELVAVDDASTDGTWERLKAWPARDSRVRVYRHERNRGKGAALRTAFSQVSSAIVVVQDADLEYDPADFLRLVIPILRGEADVVYGTRFTSQAHPSSPWWHRLGNRLLTWSSNHATGLRLTDEATCYKMFRRELLNRFTLHEDGFGFCPEFTAKVARVGARLVEMPIAYHPRRCSDGKKIRLRHGLGALWCVIKYRFCS
jgi:glycosyltransferase involved in cell wall biosynthesis